MPLRTRFIFPFEKIRLLHRGRSSEVWEGLVSGRPHFLRKVSAKNAHHWTDFVLQTQIKHQLLLQPDIGWYSGEDTFWYAMPCDFSAGAISKGWDASLFVCQFLSLANSILEKGFAFRWNSDHLFFDPKAKTFSLAGISHLRALSPAEKEEAQLDILSRLSEFLSKHDSQQLVPTLRRWERRKKEQIKGCLQEFLGQRPDAVSHSCCVSEWQRSREIELVAGLYHLAERCKGRAILFEAELGGGKSTLLKQIYCDLLPRKVHLTFFSAAKEERPYQSARKLLDQFFESVGAYRQWKSELASGRWTHFIDGSVDFPEELAVSNFLQFIATLHAKHGVVYAFLVDDLHHFDPVSLGFVTSLMRRLDSHPLLFVCAWREGMGTPADLLTLPLQATSPGTIQSSYVIPFWKNEQRKHYFEQLYRRASSNPMLFHEYLAQTLKNKKCSWTEEEYTFTENDIPELPPLLLHLYRSNIPDLTARELEFLEVASLQGESFDPALIEMADKQDLLDRLRDKAILHNNKTEVRFRKPLIAEAIYKGIETERLKALHLKLASKMLKGPANAVTATVAKHFLKGGDYSQSLSFACKAIQELRPNTAESLLPLLQELHGNSKSLTSAEQTELYRQTAKLFFRKGNHSAAIQNCKQALAITQKSYDKRFELIVQMAESYLGINDIHSAQKLLLEHVQYVPLINDEKLLLRYYLARALCGWHRGDKNEKDFAQAFQLAEGQQDYEALAAGYRQRAELALREGDLQLAQSMSRKALRYARKTDHHEEAGHALRVLGAIAWRRSRYVAAERILKRAQHAFRKVENIDGIARVWSLLGNIYTERYLFAQATDAFQNALNLFSRLNHPLELSLAQFNLGLVYIEQCRLAEAERIFSRCLTQDRTAGNKRYYAFDLRALAVLSILSGYHRKADRLLKRAAEVFQQIQADGDILPTKFLQLFNELEQKNYRQSQPLIEFLRSQLSHVTEPMAQAEIHYLLGHYHGFINETRKAMQHLHAALKLAGKIRYYKLAGKCLILKVIFRNSMPGKNDIELKRAIRFFERSHCQLEFADYLLKLYQAYPALLKEKPHAHRLAQMERLYRSIRHRPKHKIVRRLARGINATTISVEPLYGWWQDLIGMIQSPENLSDRLSHVLQELSAEFSASSALFHYCNDQGSYEKIVQPREAASDMDVDFHNRIFRMLANHQKPYCVDVKADAELMNDSWVILNEIRSIMAVPFQNGGELLGMWYFDRRGQEPPFERKELSKAAFFSMAAGSTVENVLRSEFSKRAESTTSLRSPYDDLLGSSKKMMELYRQMSKLAPVDISVLIQGESGTGKELIAKNLHRKSNRSSSPFLALNCSAIPETLIESELFGYVKGAFTGAVGSKPGLIERAHNGTLFLDEIGDLSLAAQAKLLRVMQEREIQRLGDSVARKVNVRFLFATHKDLSRMIQEGTYREDLFYRISGYVLEVPALRDRRGDIPVLVSHLVQKYLRAFGKSNITFSVRAMQRLSDYSWPGNVREMENVIQSLLINVDSNKVVEIEDLPLHIQGTNKAQRLVGLTLDAARCQFEKEFLLEALNKNKWNKTHTAKQLGITRQGLMNMIQRLDLQRSGTRRF